MLYRMYMSPPKQAAHSLRHVRRTGLTGIWFLFALMLIPNLWLVPASAQASNPGTIGRDSDVRLSHSDKNFLRQAAEENQAAIELGQVAEQKGFSTVARTFARRLVAERSAAQQSLMALARRINVALPLRLNRQDRKTKKQMETHSGKQLDRIFLAHMAVDLDRQYGSYEDTGMSTTNPEVKHYIEALLSQVKLQDQVAKNIAPGGSVSSFPSEQ